MPENTERKRNILILTSTFPRWRHDTVPGFVLDFTKHLKANNWQPTVLAPHYPEAKKREEIQGVAVKRFQYWFTKKGQNIVYNGGALSNIRKTPLYALKVCCYMATMFVVAVNIVLKQRITVLNPHWLIPQGFVAIFVKYLTGKKVVVTIHGSDIFSFNSTTMQFIKRWVLKKADEVVVNSSATLKAAQTLYNREYHVIPMGIDLEKFTTVNDNIEKIKDRHNLNNYFTLLFVGRLTEVKGAMYLLKALKILKKENKNIKALLVGDGPERERLQTYINKNNLQHDAIMTGWIDSEDIAAYYHASDVYVSPSIITDSGEEEAFGLVLAEALATGTPVIATDTGGIKDVVQNHRNGFLIKQKDLQELCEKILLLKNDSKLREKMGLAGVKYIKSNFTWASIANKYTKVLSSK